jgi:two-component system, NtrC family, sensor kinase
MAAKLAICVIASTAAFFAFFGIVNLRSEQHFSQDQVEQSANRITDLIVRSTHYEMLRNDKDALLNMIHEVGSEPGIRRIRILNKDGLIIYSTRANEVGTPVDKTPKDASGPCAIGAAGEADAPRPDAIFHRQARAAHAGGDAGHRKRARVFQRLLPRARRRQAHSGVIDTTLSLAAVDKQMAAHRANLTWFLVGAMMFGCAAAVVFMWVVVHRPVHELIGRHAPRGGGRSGVPAAGGRDDELGDLATRSTR